VVESRVLRRLDGSKRKEMVGDWRKFHNEELRNSKSSPNIIRVVKSRRMRWSGHIAHVRKRGMHTGFWQESQKERDHQNDRDIGVRIMFKGILRETGYGGMIWIHLAEDRDQWRAPVNTILSLRIP
jgi:hypothetical protein